MVVSGRVEMGGGCRRRRRSELGVFNGDGRGEGGTESMLMMAGDELWVIVDL